MGVNKDYDKIEIPVAKPDNSERHVHKFESDGGKCVICGKTIEELLAD